MVEERRGLAIAYVVDRYPELSQTFVRDEIAELRRQGTEVRVVALREGGDLDGDERPDAVANPARSVLSVFRFARLTSRHPLRVLRVLRLLRRMDMAYAQVAVLALPHLVGRLDKQQVTRVHAHFAWGASSVAAYLAAYLDLPLSITVHARDLYVDPQSLPAKFSAADTIVTVCEFNRQWLSAHGCPPDKIAVVPCGVAIPNEVVPHSGRSVLSIGRLVPKKGFDTLITAAAVARDRLPGLRLTIVGDGPERARLARLIEELGVQPIVTMMGALDHASTLKTLAEASLFALPCRVDAEGDSDALPVVIREAMARGVPVVSTFVAGIPETVTTECGWLVNSDDPVALADTMVEAFADPLRLQGMGVAGRQRVTELYTIDRSVFALREVLGI